MTSEQNERTSGKCPVVPALIADAGDRATCLFFEFFNARLTSPNTMAAYAQAVTQFARWCEERDITLQALDPIAFAAYIKELEGRFAPNTVHQHLAALRMLFKSLVTGQVVPFNPARTVQGPKRPGTKRMARGLSVEEVRTLLDRINASYPAGKRDRALLGVLMHSMASLRMILKLTPGDFIQRGKIAYLRFGDRDEPVPPNLTADLNDLITIARIASGGEPLFPTSTRKGLMLTTTAMDRVDVLKMVKRRCRAAGILRPVNCRAIRQAATQSYLA